jgi:DNA-binding CsgD family transcriptional regulator
MSWIRERFTEGRVDDADFGASLVETADQLAQQGDRDRALSLLRGAAIASYFSDGPPASCAAIADVTESVGTDPSDARRLGILAYAQPVGVGTSVIEQLEEWEADLSSDPETALMLALAGCAVGEFGLAAGYSWAAVSTLRTQGRLGYLARALIASAVAETYLATLRPALASSVEAATLALESSQPLLASLAETCAAMCVALGSGREGAERLAESAAFAVVPAGARATRSKAQHVLGLAALADGCPDEAFVHLSCAFDPADGSFHRFMRCFVLGDLADAAARSGQGGSIASIVAEIEAIGRLTRASGVHANLVYTRAVLADDEHAESLFAAALDHDLRRWPFVRARTQLAFGEWLRRERRLDESRLHLRSARESFDALGTRPWSDMAREQLRASGEASGPPAVRPETALTAQEHQIAQLAASGLTNRQIGDQLFLSHRTIGAQLYKIYPKLHITSRSDLARVLEITDVPQVVGE